MTQQNQYVQMIFPAAVCWNILQLKSRP